MKRKLLALLLALSMVLGILPGVSAAESGACGDTATWSFDRSTGTLTISGTGDMSDYQSGSIPWYKSKDIITAIVIEPGITSIGYSAFYGCTKVADVTLPDTLTVIKGCAFTDCKSLAEIVIPDSVTTIGNYAFSECAGLTGIVLPRGITAIGNYVFDACTSLAAVTIPDTVVSIGENAFSSCTALTSVILPEGLESIGAAAFSGCTGLAAVTLPDTLESIGSSAFATCGSLTGVILPEGLTDLGHSAFYKCTGLTDMVIPDQVTSIGPDTFRSCTALTSVTIGSSVDSIGAYAFEGCNKLISVTIPDSAASIGRNAFCYCDALTTVVIGNGVETIGSYAFYLCENLTSVTIGRSVASIKEDAFNHCAALRDIYYRGYAQDWDWIEIGRNNGPLHYATLHPIHDSHVHDYTSVVTDPTCTKVGYTTHSCDCGDSYVDSEVPALGHNFGPWTVTREPSGEDLGEEQRSCTRCGETETRTASKTFPLGETTTWTFDETDGSLTIAGTGQMPSGMYPSSYPWYELREQITSIVIESGITSIGYSAFYGCTNLTSVSIPDSVTSINAQVFVNCASLTDVTLPEGLTYLGHSVFYGCSSLTEMVIPQGVPEIMSDMFYQCTSLTSVTLPDSITAIGERAFSGCTSLPALTIPERVRSIGGAAFFNCKALTTMTIPDRVTSIGAMAFEDCTGLTDVKLSANLTELNDSTFQNCYKLTSIVIPEGVTIIWQHVFHDCGKLTSVTLPASLGGIGFWSFYNCASLTDVYYAGSPEQYAEIDILDFNYSIHHAAKHYFSDGSTHAHNHVAVVTAPTCTEVGYTVHTCSCGDHYTDSQVPALGHDFGQWIVTKEATEDAEGEERRDCSRCDESETRAIPKTDHVHSYTSEVTNATCTEGGYTLHTCPCGDSYTDSQVSALGHDFGKWTVVKEATEDTEGEERRDCSRCDESEIRAIPKTDHVHSYTDEVTNATCTEVGYTVHTCPCGDSYTDSQVPALGHKYGDWIILSPSTCSQEGRKIRICSRCNRGDPQPLPREQHSFQNGVCTNCGAAESATPFTDVPGGQWYTDPVLWAVEKGITSGTSASTFSPDKTCTRGQVVTFLWRAKGEPEPTLTENPFSDVKSSDYFYKAVLWAVENGITSGTSKTTFAPSNPCTRAQVVTFLWRTMGNPAPEKSDNPFTDVPAGQWYTSPVLWAVENGITSGTSKTTFAPNNPCTRAQVVTFLYRALKDQ